MTNQTLESLAKKKIQLQARLQSLTARESTQKRREETRKKILAGTYILDKHQREGTLKYLYSELDKFLTRKHDRILFGLPVVDDLS